MRSPTFQMKCHSSDITAPGDIADLLEADEESDSQIEVKAGIVLHELTQLIKWWAAFARLKSRLMPAVSSVENRNRGIFLSRSTCI